MIYLDHAATSFPKPREVIEAQTRCMKETCGNAGRGSHQLALAAAEEIYACRESLAELMDMNDPTRVVFTANATAALNTAIKGILRAGDHVLISDLEHNAVLRPIYRLASEGRISYDVFPSYARRESPRAERILAEIQKRLRKNTKMIVATHASNICSATLPIREIGAFCRERGICFVVDAAQSAGRLPISMQEMKIDALCLPSHKGLWGPQGSGALLLSEGVEVEGLIDGGSGVFSLEPTMPTAYPERLEAGTLPTPCIAAWRAGIDAVRRTGQNVIAERERSLTTYLQRRLQRIPRVRILAPHHLGSILLFYAAGIPAERLGKELDKYGICVRAGFHCAALAHRTLGTPTDGAVRVSVGFDNAPEEMDALADALSRILLH